VWRSAAAGDRLAVDRDRQGRGQEGDHGRDLAGVDERAGQVAAGHPPLDLGGLDAGRRCLRDENARRRLGTGQPGVDGVHVDAGRAQLVGQVLGHRRHGHVADGSDDRPGAEGGQPADADDPAPAGLDHARRHRLGTPQVAHHLDVHIRPERIAGDLGQRQRRRLPGRPSGAVDQDVDAAKPVPRGRHQFPHGSVVAGVNPEGGHGPARGCAQLGSRLGQPGRVTGRDRHLSALGQQRRRGRLADAAATAGHERPPSSQLQIHLSVPSIFSPLCLVKYSVMPFGYTSVHDRE
jgi:hypothetical protein